MSSKIHLQPARAQDLPNIADLAAQAMLEDELCAWLCPQRHEHFADFRYAFLRRLKMRFVAPGYVMMVAVEQLDEDPHGRIFVERKLLDIENGYLSWVYPDRSVDPHRLEHYKTASAAVDCFPFSAFPELWYLGHLAVDPKHQRRGIGRQLVEWGLQQARQEEVCVGLEASIKGTGLYEKLGFHTINTKDLTPEIAIQAMVQESPRSWLSAPRPDLANTCGYFNHSIFYVAIAH
ncbi:GNAT family acetyltransferase [Penicillium alfredii]|uniref:GNAT family acetyltransferase n=1 Tax=Penicillium alfredii TaxID=1506179 RepID=A0A9W9FJC0_9EURO|nr:GNAT family acetyltransferase [Penicillium alfredii]KAJ5101276.1 GNAT family acetyltransferase [Penicillium alfredii]